MSAARLALPVLVNVLVLVIFPVQICRRVLIIVCEICLCVKCLVLWRFVSSAPQKKDVEKKDVENKLDAQNRQESTGKVESVMPSSISPLESNLPETPRLPLHESQDKSIGEHESPIDVSPQDGLPTG